MNLQLLGLTHIPREVLAMTTSLLRLRLDFNDRLVLAAVPAELHSLKLLSMRACSLAALPPDIHQENLLESLPSTFTRIRALVRLGTVQSIHPCDAALHY